MSTLFILSVPFISSAVAMLAAGVFQYYTNKQSTNR